MSETGDLLLMLQTRPTKKVRVTLNLDPALVWASAQLEQQRNLSRSVIMGEAMLRPDKELVALAKQYVKTGGAAK